MTQEKAFSILKTGANVFLTGEPGSGKTYLVNRYVAYLRSVPVETAITASTGIAATHIGGMTIHSWSGIGIKNKLEKRDLRKILSHKYITRPVSRARVLIIDEVSMLPPETLAMVDAVCREARKSSEPFGGLQIVLVGDFFQLPPIVRRENEESGQNLLLKKAVARFAYDSAIWARANPTICYLTEQYRQDDQNFLSLLSAIRQNVFSSEHSRHLQSRETPADKAPQGAPKLFSHNVDVDRVNEEMLAKIPGPLKKFAMSSNGAPALVAGLKKGCLSPEKLSLKVGASVMFTKNNLKGGFVNGTLGVVQGFDNIGYPRVRTRDGKLISVQQMDWTVEENGKIRARIHQLPLRLAWAITVHKSQGMSLDEAVMDLSQVFEFGQGYVALSRVRRLSGVHLLNWNERSLQVDPAVLAKDKLFRLASETAEEEFADISQAALKEMQEGFIEACKEKSFYEPLEID